MATPQIAQPASLLRQVGFLSATALVVSNMVGSGIFAYTGFMAGDLGNARLILLVWIAGALFALCGAFAYSELGMNFPSSGGEYVYLTRAYGPTWGFMTGWVSFFAGFSAPIAAAALAFSDYVGYFFPVFRQASAAYTLSVGSLAFQVGGAQLLASLLIAGFVVLNCLGIARTARVQNVLTGTKIAVLLAFIFFGFLTRAGDWGNFPAQAVRTSTATLPVQFMISLLWIMVAYSGWNAATYVAEEIKDPERTLPAALATGTALVAAIYLGMNLLLIYSTPLEKMKGVVAIGSLAASRLFGPQVAGLFAGLMALSITSTVNAMVTIGPRVYYAMAQNHAFFPAAARVNPAWRTPVAAIVAQGVCAMLMTLTPFPQLIVYIGFSLTFFTVAAVASVFLFRKRPDWRRLPAVDFAYPLVPAAYVLVGTGMCVYGMIWQPRASFTALGTIAAGALVYRYTFRLREQ